ncbi:uncharacterized protein CDV56_102689 [Aspergillus thermomutatus]|uniref:Uncharacterized protein n=1 Tax=Aspergillus thermomutatus TaxID=41047 RepID=A0A397HMN6_ASPTH|nr:uncharacterized protein CDV56_102689 [Aspergillus thermomutatus]RHZ64421.1 hypothetical protein CDV56_102689 [Aspergillus thermomutatus]
MLMFTELDSFINIIEYERPLPAQKEVRIKGSLRLDVGILTFEYHCTQLTQNSNEKVDMADFPIGTNGTLEVDSVSCTLYGEKGALDPCSLFLEQIELSAIVTRSGSTRTSRPDCLCVIMVSEEAHPSPNCEDSITLFRSACCDISAAGLPPRSKLRPALRLALTCGAHDMSCILGIIGQSDPSPGFCQIPMDYYYTIE